MAVEFMPLVKVKGEKGNPGPVGPRGPVGPQGAPGIPGVNGVTTDTAIAAAVDQLLESQTGQALLRFLGNQAWATRLAPGFVKGQVPAALGWPATLGVEPSLSVDESGRIRGSAGFTAEQVFDFRSTARTAPNVTIYVSGQGNDANDGLSWATAMRTIRGAVFRVNEQASAVGGRIFIDGSDPEAFRDGFGQYSTGTYLKALNDIAFIGVNGTPEIGPWVSLEGAEKDATFTNTTRAAWNPGPSSSFPNPVAMRAIDTAYVDAQGVHRDLEWRDTPSQVNAERGTWTLNAGNLYIRRHDDRLATSRNTKVFSPGNPNFFIQTESDVYVENLRFLGGRGNGVVTVANEIVGQTGTLVVFNKVEASYGGFDIETGAPGTDNTNGFAVTNFNGFTMFFDCKAHGNKKDGFNFYAGAADNRYTLNVNCEAYDNGRWEALTCNGWTLHESMIGIDIAGRYSRSRGGTVNNVGTSLSYCFGTVSTDDYGDIDWGGTTPVSQFMTQTDAKMWCDHTMVAGTGYGYVARGTSQMFVRDIPAHPLEDFNVVEY